MNKTILPILIGIVIVLGGLYYVLNPVGTTTIKEPQQKTSENIKKKNNAFNPCAIVKNLGKEGKCQSKHITYKQEDAALIKIADSYGILLSDKSYFNIMTDIYFEPKSAIEAYLKTQSIEVSENDWNTVEYTLQKSKRGYLLVLNFKTPKEGTLYVSPDGRISGRLK